MTAPLLVFDLDGTLVETAPDLLGAIAAVLPRHGYSAPVDSRLRDAIGHGALHLIEAALARQNVKLAKPALDAIFQDFLQHYEANIAVGSHLFPGITALLDRFASAGWAFAVCTNKKEHLSRLLLKELGVAERFAAICGGDTFPTCKPDPAHLTGTIAAAGGVPETSVLVGDSITDRDTARRAEVPFIGVPFGYTPVPMSRLEPDLLIDSYDKLSPDLAAGLLRQRREERADARSRRASAP